MQYNFDKSKWYQKTWAIVLLLIFFFPIGLFLMWKYGKWKRIHKVIVTVLVALVVIGSVSSNPSTSNNVTTSNKQETIEEDKSIQSDYKEQNEVKENEKDRIEQEQKEAAEKEQKEREAQQQAAAQAQQQANQAAQNNPQNGEMVWLSATGNCYHRINNCGKMNPNKARQVTRAQAIEQGYSACSKCW